MNNRDKKALLPVHLILGASDMSRIKTAVPARVGEDGMPIADKTTLGWTTTQEDYIHLCSLNVLGLEDHAEGDQGNIYREFKEQLTQRDDGQYETSLPWKANHPELPTKYHMAKRRFQSLVNRLEKQPELLSTYHDIIENQLKDGVVEIAPEKPEGNREHYILAGDIQQAFLQIVIIEIERDAKEILNKGGFVLHKWHSNAAELESERGRW